MKRVQTKHAQVRGILVTVAVFVLMVLLLTFALTRVDERSQQEQTKTLEDALLRATLTCYAVEGRYPSNVDYLKNSYGIVYDEEKYIVSMDAFAMNILPDIRVLIRGGDPHEQ